MTAMTTIALLAAWPAVPWPTVTPIRLTGREREALREVAFEAARTGDTKTLREYFRAGFPADIRTPRGDTLLILAAYHGHADAARLILARDKESVDATNAMGLTALTGAAFKGHSKAVALLLESGADPNAANESGQTPLMFAALVGRAEAVRQLLRAGADPDAKDAAGNTPLSLARSQGDTETIRLLESAPARP